MLQNLVSARTGEGGGGQKNPDGLSCEVEDNSEGSGGGGGGGDVGGGMELDCTGNHVGLVV